MINLAEQKSPIKVQLKRIERVFHPRIKERIRTRMRWNDRGAAPSAHLKQTTACVENSKLIVLRTIARSTGVSIVLPTEHLVWIEIFGAHMLDLIRTGVLAIVAALAPEHIRERSLDLLKGGLFC